jgi:hypothetical protein
LATVATQSISLVPAGAGPTMSAASGGGDRFTPTERTFLLISNASGSTITATVVTPRTGPGGVAIADLAVTVNAGVRGQPVGGFNPADFAATDGLADVTWSATTSVTFAVLSL